MTPGYIGTLASLPEAEKQALLYGNWDSFSGPVRQWRNDPNHYKDQRWTHVIEPFPFRNTGRMADQSVSRSRFLWGGMRQARAGFYRIKELYGCTGTPNEGLRKDPMKRHG